MVRRHRSAGSYRRARRPPRRGRAHRCLLHHDHLVPAPTPCAPLGSGLETESSYAGACPLSDRAGAAAQEWNDPRARLTGQSPSRSSASRPPARVARTGDVCQMCTSAPDARYASLGGRSSLCVSSRVSGPRAVQRKGVVPVALVASRRLSLRRSPGAGEDGAAHPPLRQFHRRGVARGALARPPDPYRHESIPLELPAEPLPREHLVLVIAALRYAHHRQPLSSTLRNEIPYRLAAPIIEGVWKAWERVV